MNIKTNPELSPLIEELLLLSEQDLCVFLGNEEFKSELSSNFISPGELFKKVKNWLHNLSKDIKQRVCNDQIVKQEIGQNRLEKVVLAGHIAVLLTGIGHTEVTMAAIAVYYINYGYKQICNGQDI